VFADLQRSIVANWLSPQEENWQAVLIPAENNGPVQLTSAISIGFKPLSGDVI
jgi:hypothetical protein